MSNALEIDTLWEGMPDELSPRNWQRYFIFDSRDGCRVAAMLCPYCSALVRSGRMHLSASPECVRQLREAKEKAMEGKHGD